MVEIYCLYRIPKCRISPIFYFIFLKVAQVIEEASVYEFECLHKYARKCASKVGGDGDCSNINIKEKVTEMLLLYTYIYFLNY